jgi:beta-glucanase (GH16 family)
MNKTINWCGYEWLTQERWGKIHPDKDYFWYDEESVKLLDNGDLILETKYNHYEFTTNEGIKKISEVGAGLVSNLTKFSYGHFEIEAKLPSGNHLWASFWMWSFESWPPELDIFEGYTNRKGSYFNWNLRIFLGGFWRVKTNIHLGHQPNNYNLGAKSHWLGFKSPDKKFNKYSCYWDENKLIFYFNGKIVREVTDLKYLNQLKGKTMNIIINNGITKLDDTNQESEFIIKYFKYTPK